MEVTEDATAMKNQPSKRAIPQPCVPEYNWWNEVLPGVARDNRVASKRLMIWMCLGGNRQRG